MGRFRTFPAEHDRGEMMLPEEQPHLEYLTKLAQSKSIPEDSGITEKPLVPYKYHEDTILKEVADYIDTTYKGHYVGDDNVQSLDLILATGHATGFNVGNILKYGSRYGKKRGYNRDDLLKVIHYAIFELYNHSKIHMEK